MSMMINLYNHEYKSTKWIFMYNDTMDMKLENAIKEHEILKTLQYT